MTENEDRSGAGIGRSFDSFQKIIKQSGPAASASYGLVASILLFTFIGWSIDANNNTSPIGVLVGVFFGILVGFYHLIKTMSSKKY
tara:strand:+ start:860 stop:1117 length:258 start_codon:yes stop_codon:yes gene_type:complete